MFYDNFYQFKTLINFVFSLPRTSTNSKTYLETQLTVDYTLKHTEVQENYPKDDIHVEITEDQALLMSVLLHQPEIQFNATIAKKAGDAGMASKSLHT